MSKKEKKVNVQPTPIYIKHEAKLKQDRLVALVPGEVGWFGIVDDSDGFIVVEDIIVPEQEVTSASVDYSADQIGALMEEYPDVVHKVKYFGHSHYTMDAYFSSIDEEDFIDKLAETGIDYFVCHVQNKEGKSETRIDQFNPIRIEGHPCELISLIPTEVADWTKEQVKEKVTVKKATTVTKYSKPISSTTTPVVHERQDVPKVGKAIWIDGEHVAREYVDGKLVSETAQVDGDTEYEESTELEEVELANEYIPVDIEDEDEFFGELEQEYNRQLGWNWYDSSW